MEEGRASEDEEEEPSPPLSLFSRLPLFFLSSLPSSVSFVGGGKGGSVTQETSEQGWKRTEEEEEEEEEESGNPPFFLPPWRGAVRGANEKGEERRDFSPSSFRAVVGNGGREPARCILAIERRRRRAGSLAGPEGEEDEDEDENGVSSPSPPFFYRGVFGWSVAIG